jgi:shikimate kinase
LAPDRPAIIVTGGGIVLRHQNVDRLKSVGTVVWLAADEAILFERAARRDHRPLLQKGNPRAIFSKLFSERESLYAAAADIRIDTSRMSHDEVAETILNKMEEFSSPRR